MKMKRIDSLQGLRAIAFISVFLGHCGIGGGGSMGVSVFLVLSGFLMIYNYWNREPKSGVKENFLFSLKKIRKLYPLHIVMLMPMLVLKGYGEIVDGSFRTSMQFVLQILADFFLVQAWVPFREFYFSFNGVAWYLSVCVFLYFVFPFFLKWMKRKYKLYTAILTIVIIFFTQTILSNFAATNIGSAIVYNNLWFTYIFPVFRLGDFLIGCCLGYIFLQNTSSSVSVFKATVIEVVAFIIMFVTHMIRLYSNLPECVLESVIYIPASTAVIYVIALNQGLISSILSKKFFVCIAGISAYAFLIHQVIINMMESIGFNSIIVVIGSFIITLTMAYVYQFILDHISVRKM